MARAVGIKFHTWYQSAPSYGYLKYEIAANWAYPISGFGRLLGNIPSRLQLSAVTWCKMIQMAQQSLLTQNSNIYTNSKKKKACTFIEWPFFSNN